MQTKQILFVLMTVATLGAAGAASAQGPGASGAAATIPERDVRPSMGTTTTAPSGMTNDRAATVGQTRERVPAQGTTAGTGSVGTSNPENSTSR